jgi:DNA-binding transcriptional MerR regulator
MPYKETKVEKIFFTIRDLAQEFHVKPHTIRFWDDEFEITKEDKDPYVTRRYSIKERELFIRIHHLLRTEKMTIAGAKKKMVMKVVSENPFQELLPRLQQVRIDLLALLKKLNSSSALPIGAEGAGEPE